MEVTINTGRLHQFPLESTYSIFRRLKTSNRGMTTDDFNRYFIWRNARRYEDRLSIVLALNFGDKSYLPDYYEAIDKITLTSNDALSTVLAVLDCTITVSYITCHG